MEDKNKRNQYLKIRVSQEEMDAIKKKFQNSKMPTLSDFVRAIIFEGYIIQMDNNELKKIERTVITSPTTSIRSPTVQTAHTMSTKRILARSSTLQIRFGDNCYS